MILEIYTKIISFLANFAQSMGYLGIFIWMVIESSLIPFPSELMLIPAGFLVAKGEMSFSLVLFFATLGALIGALFNYYLAYFLGRKTIDSFFLKHQKFFFLNKKTIDKSENFFLKYGEITTFLGRLIPGIRQIISLPAGFSKMNLITFSIFTILGAGIWNFILIYLGEIFYQNQDIIKHYIFNISLLTFLFSILIVLVYILMNILKRDRENKK